MSTENIRFYINTRMLNHIKGVQIHQELTEAYGEDIISLRQVQRIMKEYKNGEREGYIDVPKSGRPKSEKRRVSRIEVSRLIEDEPNTSIVRIADILDLSEKMVERILKEDLNLISRNMRFVPYSLSPVQKQNRIEGARTCLETLEKRGIANRFVVTDEKWIYARSLGSSSTRKAWVSPEGDVPTVPRRMMSDTKHLAIVAVCFDGKHYFEILEQGATVDSNR